MESNRGFIVTFVITAVLLFVAVFGVKIGGFEIKGADQMRYGIDIKGGVEAIYEPGDLGRAPTPDELEAARTIIETRMDARNITDRDVTIDKGNGKIIARFPWKSDEADFDPQQAVTELGETSRLTFRDPEGRVILEGTDVTRSKAQLDPRDGGPVVTLELTREGAEKFAAATGRLVGQEISIYMDEILIRAPIVNSKITGGNAEISNLSSIEDAAALAGKINSGSLPFSLVVKNCSIISPTLGSNALAVMIMAGKAAFIMVCLFILFYYRLPGMVACIALVLQVTGQLLALSIPQFTLTLPGIAGLILSVGMGVDANIIIAERIKEEINTGKTIVRAIDTGFERAFSAVFDGNITVVIIAVILIIFGSGSMLSFGYTLICGVCMNFIAGVTASRLMIRSLANYKIFRRPQYYGARRQVNDQIL